MSALALRSSRRVVVPLAPRVRARPDGEILHLHGETMGTTWSLQCVAREMPLAGLRCEVEAILGRIVAQMSPWDAESDLSRFNRAPPGNWQELPSEFAAVLDYALLLAEDTDDAFDPTLASLVEAWGFGPRGARITQVGPGVSLGPSPQAWRRLAAAREGTRARQPGGILIDLCAVARVMPSTVWRSTSLRATAATFWSRSAANCAARA